MLTTIYPSLSSSVIRSALFLSGKTNTDLDHSFPPFSFLFLIHIVPIYYFFCCFFVMNKKSGAVSRGEMV